MRRWRPGNASIGISLMTNPPTTAVYTLSLHDALPISAMECPIGAQSARSRRYRAPSLARGLDRKSTRLNSSHTVSSYAVFCLKKKSGLRLQQVTRGGLRACRVSDRVLQGELPGRVHGR